MVKDFVSGIDNDLVIAGGKFNVAESDEQHVADILASIPGQWKQWPILGVDLAGFINSSANAAVIERNIAIQLEADGYKNISIKKENNEFTIDAVR